MDKRYREQLKKYLLLLYLEGNKKKMYIWLRNGSCWMKRNVYYCQQCNQKKTAHVDIICTQVITCSNFSIGIKRNSQSFKRNDIDKNKNNNW